MYGEVDADRYPLYSRVLAKKNVSIRQHTARLMLISTHCTVECCTHHRYTYMYVSVCVCVCVCVCVISHVSIRSATSAYGSIRQHTYAVVNKTARCYQRCIRQHTSEYVSIRTLTHDADVADETARCYQKCIRQHTSAYVSVRS